MDSIWEMLSIQVKTWIIPISHSSFVSSSNGEYWEAFPLRLNKGERVWSEFICARAGWPSPACFELSAVDSVWTQSLMLSLADWLLCVAQC